MLLVGPPLQFIPRGPMLASRAFAWRTRPHGFGNSDTVPATVTGSVTALCPLSLSVKPRTPALLQAKLLDISPIPHPPSLPSFSLQPRLFILVYIFLASTLAFAHFGLASWGHF